jgi:hypothetical protein
MKLGQYGEVALDIAVAVAAYSLFRWIGFALWTFFVFCCYGYQIVNCQKTMMNTLLSRLPDRCAMCHREIVDEGGIIDDDGEGIYHEKCMDKLDTIRASSQPMTPRVRQTAT